MKRLVLIFSIISIAVSISAQNKSVTIYYADSTRTIDLANSDSLKFFVCGVSTIEYAGKTYNTVLIGNQCWLKENLNVGSRIQGNVSATNNSIIEKYCYGNDSINCDIYGGLYSWNEAMQYSTTQGSQGICPPGWRIPTFAELQILSGSVNGSGNSLKAVGQGTGAGAGTNASGFSALLTGHRNFDGSFVSFSVLTNFWSSTEFSTTNSNSLHLGYENSGIFFTDYSKDNGYCIRCIKD